MIALKAREEAFAECQQLMEESAKAAEKCESFQGTYGNLVVDAEGIAFEGLATDRLFKKVSLAYKDTKVGSRAIAMRALADPDVTKSFYMYATAAARSSNGRHGSGTDAPGAADARSPEMASDDPSISEQHIGLRTTTQRPSMIENWEAPCPWADLRASQDTRRDNAKSRQTTTVRR